MSLPTTQDTGFVFDLAHFERILWYIEICNSGQRSFFVFAHFERNFAIH